MGSVPTGRQARHNGRPLRHTRHAQVLLKAYQKLDAAVGAAYALNGGKKDLETSPNASTSSSSFTSATPGTYTDKKKLRRKNLSKPAQNHIKNGICSLRMESLKPFEKVCLFTDKSTFLRA